MVKKKLTEAFDEDNTSDEEVFKQECALHIFFLFICQTINYGLFNYNIIQWVL